MRKTIKEMLCELPEEYTLEIRGNFVTLSPADKWTHISHITPFEGELIDIVERLAENAKVDWSMKELQLSIRAISF